MICQALYKILQSGRLESQYPPVLYIRKICNMNKSKKLAIFDLDGTLANTIEDLATAVNYGLIKLGYPIHHVDKYNNFVGNGIMKLCERALPAGKSESLPELFDIFNTFYQNHCMDKTKEYSGMTELLRQLSRNSVDIAVATNKTQKFSEKIISGLFPYIKFIKVLGGCEERPKKPAPDIIYEITGDREYSEIYMIGDSNVDIMTAKNAGIKSIGCLWGFRTEAELREAGADYIVSKPSEIKKIIV